MKPIPAKISLILLTLLFLSSCNAVKRLEDDQNLLTNNRVLVNGERTGESRVHNQLYQRPNSRLLGFPLQLHVYNLADPTPDSTFQDWLYRRPNRRERLVSLLSAKQVERLGESYVDLNEWLEDVGEAPVIVNEQRVERSAERLRAWYWNRGWFDAETSYEIIPKKNQRAEVRYEVITNRPYIIDSVTTRIASGSVDSIYEMHRQESMIKPGMRYRSADFGAERERLTTLFRNNGIYHFEQEYITFEADTVGTEQKVNAAVLVQNREAVVDGVSTRIPFNVYRISKVNVFPDYNIDNRDDPVTDTASYEGYDLYSFDELRYRPRALTDAIFITPGTIYSDSDRTLTYNRLNQLRIFRYPNIQFIEDPEDTTNTSLIANIFLTPRPKYSLGFEFDVSQSNIQRFGIGFGGSLLVRNLFGGAEILELSGRGSIGASKEVANNINDRFFDITEVGTDVKLTLPRIMFPISTERFIPKYMYPFTSFSLGASTQNNIGLDRQSLTAIMNYRWFPSEILTHQLDLLNIQYVRNLNTANYFNVYQNSFQELNRIATSTNVDVDDSYFIVNDQGIRRLSIPEGAENFLSDTRDRDFNLTPNQLQNLNDIRERKNRLTEDNLIFASNFSYILNKKEDIYDEDFSRLRVKVESAGNFLSGFSRIADLEQDETGRYNIFGVNFSQYIRTEVDYIKHWDLGRDNVFAIRTFGGIAIPYGNSNSIPFIRSFFAGGPNDNRAWQAYSLGPGSSGGRNEFNEANLKLAFSAEYRFRLLGDFRSALFIDTGNIWNVFDVVEEEASTFTSLADLRDIAVGTGVGLRYDFSFFVLRFDLGFKTYNPAREIGNRWFTDFSLSQAVFNVGINYPF